MKRTVNFPGGMALVVVAVALATFFSVQQLHNQPAAEVASASAAFEALRDHHEHRADSSRRALSRLTRRERHLTQLRASRLAAVTLRPTGRQHWIGDRRSEVNPPDMTIAKVHRSSNTELHLDPAKVTPQDCRRLLKLDHRLIVNLQAQVVLHRDEAHALRQIVALRKKESESLRVIATRYERSHRRNRLWSGLAVAGGIVVGVLIASR